jgi:hypothetical protein
MFSKMPVAILILVCSSVLLNGQDTTSGGSDSVLTSPYGVPRMVMNEGGQWNAPLKVFEDATKMAYTPDITAPGWVAGNADQFRNTGTYYTYLYVYNKRKQTTGRWLLIVETRTNTAVVKTPFSTQHISLSDHATPAFISKSAAKITAIVTREIGQFHNDTFQDVIRKDKLAVARMIACDNNSPDCNLSDEDFQKKHPIYAK